MNRPFAYIGQAVLEWMISKPAQDTMLSVGKLAQALAGTSTFTVGLACTPNSPAALNVLVGEGEIYMMEAVEASTMGTLPIDTTHQVMKQGMLRDAVTLACPAPGTAGQSINYLVQATYQDADVSIDPTNGNTPVVLQYFGGTVGGTPYSGPGNTGATSNTFRKGVCTVTVKAGAAATTGSQVTPAPDAGCVGLYVVTVANGAATIIAGNITPYSGAPASLPNLSQVPLDVQNSIWTYAADTGAANAYVVTLTPAPTAYATGQRFAFKAANANTGASTLNVNGLGAKTIAHADGSALAAGDILAGTPITVTYDGAAFALTPSNVRNMFSGRQDYQSPGSFTWTCPAGVYRAYVRVWGAGGSGGSSSSAGSGGGSGGGYDEAFVAVTPGTGYAVTVGAQGTVVSAGNNGIAGGSSSFSTFCAATGGAGGFQGGSISGAAGTGTAGQLSGEGGIGGSGLGSFGGAGGSGAMGGGGGPSTSNTSGAGGFPGGGGSGGATGISSAAGAVGYVSILW